ncbi:hypothetical protein V1511DRAFT_190150 [Dipodascopsis uninucleata]
MAGNTSKKVQKPTTTRRRIDREPRSRSGCLTCRARHKRCDQRAPTCMNCERLKIKCEGYSSILRWQERFMLGAQIPDTFYHSVRYVNLHSNDYKQYGNEVEVLLDIYSPYDVKDSNNNYVRPPLNITAASLSTPSRVHHLPIADSTTFTQPSVQTPTPTPFMKSAIGTPDLTDIDDSGASSISTPFTPYNDSSSDYSFPSVSAPLSSSGDISVGSIDSLHQDDDYFSLLSSGANDRKLSFSFGQMKSGFSGDNDPMSAFANLDKDWLCQPIESNRKLSLSLAW